MIDLRQLRYFVVVCEELNFGRAAARLHITQPPLSQQIMQLESSLDAQLFIRGKRPLRLTHAGVQLLSGARRLLAQADVVIEDAKQAGRGERGRLGITFLAGALPRLLPSCIAAYKHRYPGIRLDLREGVTQRQTEAILAGEMDVGFCRPLGIDNAELVTLRLISEPMMLALPESHPLTSLGRVPLAALSAEPFILFSRKDAFYFYNIVSHILQNAGVSPEVIQDATQLYTVIALVSSGVGLSIVPASAQHMRFPGLAFRHLDVATPVHAELDLIWRADDTHPALLNFIEIAQYQATL